MIDLDELERAAREATNGPWEDGCSDNDGDGFYYVSQSKGRSIARLAYYNPAADARFIALANPATVLALVQELRTARERIEKLREAMGVAFGYIDQYEEGDAWHALRTALAADDKSTGSGT